MANKVYNMDGGLHSSAALGGLEDAMYGSSVANSTSFVVTAGTGMNVSIATGDGLISTGTGFARRIATDAVNTVAITAASTANPRIDSIVAYIDNSVTPVQTVLNNTNGILKFTAVAGSPAASPVAPSAGAIQTAVGAGNPYMVLYNVTVPANATSLTAATFTDMRNIANEVSTGDVVDDAITTDKIDWTTIVKSLNDTAFGDGYIDFGTVRLMWMNRQQTGLNTAAGGYNQWTANLPASFGSGNFTVVCAQISDTGNISGDDLKIYAKSATSVSLNYSHTGAIGSGTLNYSVIAIGKKP